MITINFSPVRLDSSDLKVSVLGTLLTVNGIGYELSEIPEGATVKHDVLKTVSRDGDNYKLTLTLPHGANAPKSTRFPVPVDVTTDGPVAVPAYNEVA